MMVVEKPPCVKTTPDLQITNYIITIIQSYLPRNVPHARVGGLGDGVQNYDKCPGVPDAQNANKSGHYGEGVGWSVKRPIIPIYTLKEICLKQGSGYNPDVLSQTYRIRLNQAK